MKALFGVIFLLLTASAALANISLKFKNGTDEFNFHAQYHGDPFAPTDHFEIQIWNCPDGQMPDASLSSDPVCVTSPPPDLQYEAAQLLYSIEAPANTCVDHHGSSCSFRDREAGAAKDGLVRFRVLYDNGNHGNKIWLRSFGDLSLATSPNMYLVIHINGQFAADLAAPFAPIGAKGWIFRF